MLEHCASILLREEPNLKDLKMLPKPPTFDDAFLSYERADMRVNHNFKIGLLLRKPGQTTEEQMFSNKSGSQDFENFLSLLGDKVKLKGFTGFTGGLDNKGNHLFCFLSYSLFSRQYDG